MLNKNQKLNNELFDENVAKKSIRDGFGDGLVEAGEKDKNVVVLTADLAESMRVTKFKEKFPERFIEMGVAEQAMVTVASGMANYGKIPFATSFAVFSPGRNLEQIRTTIAINDVPVKIVGGYGGFGNGADGATHQAFEDICLMRAMPNMVVVVPCDEAEAKKATLALAENGKPSYLRLSRSNTASITTKETPFKIGKAEVFWNSLQNHKSQISNSVCIVAAGPLLYEALLAARQLQEEGINSVVINCHTIKPLDNETIIYWAKETGAVVTVEEHQIAGGLGGAVAESLAQNCPVPMEFIGMHDSFGESGEVNELLKKHKMKPDDIVRACKNAIKRKKG